MSDQIDLEEARKYLIQIILEAGEILKNFFASGDYTSIEKEGVDFTTQADEETDKFLRESLRKKYPEANFLTEETAPDDYSNLKDKKNLWVIDPLDGTINFSRKHPHFSISVALLDQGIPRLGVIYLPMENKLYWAQEDQEEAFLNGNPIKVSTTSVLRTSVIACDWGWILDLRLNVVRWLGKISTHVRQIKSMGSAVADLASLAEGRIDGYVVSGIKPWDGAAAILLVQKAGGKITTPEGKPYDVFNFDIFASNKILHNQILRLLNKS